MASYLSYRNVLLSNSTVIASTLNAGSVSYSTLTGSTMSSRALNVSTLSGSTITVSTLTGSTLNAGRITVSTIAFQSTTIALGQSTSQTNNFTNGSFTAWVSTLSTTASTAGAGLARVQRVTMSQSGQYQLAVQSSVASHSVVKSSDSGVTWQTLTNGENGLPAGSPAYTSISYSATGQYALAAVNEGGLYVSNNATAATPTFTTLTFTPYAYLPFDNSVTDVSGNSNPIATGSPAYVTGQVGNAINLANTMGSTATKYIRGTWSGSNNFTVSGRFNAQTVTAGQYGTIFSALGTGIILYITNTGTLTFFIGSSSVIYLATTYSITPSTWYSFTIIYQLGSVSSLTVNGTLIASTSNTGAIANTWIPSNQFGLGTYDNSLGNAFNGYIDDFRIYNYATTATNFSHTAVSATGQYMLAAAAGGGLFQSTNYGQTWTQVNALLNGGVWTSLSQSESGQYALATTSAATIQPNLTGLAVATWSTNGVSWAASSSTYTSTIYSYNLFDNNYNQTFNFSSLTYNQTTNSSGTYTTIQSIGSVQGDWVQLQSSVPLVITSYQVATGNAGGAHLWKNFYIIGSNDGSTWYPIQQGNIVASPNTAPFTLISNVIVVNNSGSQTFANTTITTSTYATTTTAFTYFRFVFLSSWSSTGYVIFSELPINFVGGLTCTSNYGQTWSNNNFLGTAQSFSAISGDGQYTLTGTGQTAYLIQNYLGLATQSYITVTLPSINASISGAACSNTGQYMVVVTQGSTNNVYYSTNYGSAWTALTVGSSAMTSCVMSVDGTYITVSNATNVYTLNWNGQGFTLAIGSQAGAVNQANNAIAIGNQAGQTNQTANSIVLNASGSAVNPYTQGFYVAPIQPAISSLAPTFPLLGYGSDNQIVQSATSFSNSQQTVYGEWIQYQLATASPITSYTLQSRTGGSVLSRYPISWIIVGSNDGTNWTLLDTQTGTSGWGTYTLTQVIASYTYYRMVITQINGATLDIGGFILNNGSPLFGPSANYTVVASGNYNVLQQNSVTVCTTTFSWPNTIAVNSLGVSADGGANATYQPGWIPTMDGYTRTSNYFLGFFVTGFGLQYEYNASGIAFQGTSTTINTTVLGNTNMAGTLCLMNGSRVGIGSTAPQYTLDVAGTMQANGPIPAAGQPDSAAVVPNSTFAQTWNLVSGLSASAVWYGAAVSATGQYMTVCIYGAASGNNIYYSSNYGSTWTLATGFAANVNYASVSMSGSGQYQLVGVNTAGGAIYLSKNYGATWAAISGLTGVWFHYALSYTGQYQYVGESIASTGKVYYSSNYGATFTQVTAFTGNVSGGICCSASGQYVTVTLNGGYIWYSSNYGVSWASFNTTAAWQGVCCSASGQYQTAALYNESLYYSNNYGVNWTSSGAPTTNWVNVTCSASGQYQMATGNSMSVYYSTNYGVSWTQSHAPSGNWWIAMSQNGLYTLGMITSGAVYLSTLANVGLVTNGRVGIGVTNPESLLTLYGSNIGAIAPTLVGQWKAQHAICATPAYCLKLGAHYTGGVGAYSSIQSTEYYSGTEHPGNLTLQPIGGNVGIGTTNPYKPLHISGSSTGDISALIANINTALASSASLGFGLWPASGSGSGTSGFAGQISAICMNAANGNTDMTFSVYTGSSVAPNYTLVERMRITAAGKVGIGTTNPTALLHIYGSSTVGDRDSSLRVSTQRAGLYLASLGSGGADWNIWSTLTGESTGAGALAFYDQSNASFRMVINNLGRVGIGIVTPGYQLTLGTDSAAKPSTSTWIVSSDERIKENIVLADVDRCMEIIRAVPLKHYRWKDSVYTLEQVKDRSKLGWIAQDVEKVFPKAVGTHRLTYNQAYEDVVKEDGSTEKKLVSEDVMEDCRDLNVDQMYAVMYGAIQKLVTENDEKTAQISTQTEQIASLESQLTAQASQLTSQTQQLSAQTAELTAQASQLSAQTAELTAQASQLSAQTAELTSQASQLTAQSEQLTAQSEQLSEVLSRLAALESKS